MTSGSAALAQVGFQRHSVTGVVGHLDDLGTVGPKGTRRILATLRQPSSVSGEGEIWHQLIFDDEEAERVMGLRLAAGDLIMVEIARLRAKAYIIHEGGTPRPFPYIESLASSALALRRAGEEDPAGPGEPEGGSREDPPAARPRGVRRKRKTKAERNLGEPAGRERDLGERGLAEPGQGGPGGSEPSGEAAKGRIDGGELS